MDHGNPYENAPTTAIIACDRCRIDCGHKSYSLVGFPGRAWCGACFARLADPSPALNRTPGAPSTNPLPSILSALDLAIDMASVRLGRLKEGSSAWKTQRGVLRGLQEARDIIRANGGP